MLEQTLILLKPDAVQRAFIGEIISRFEKTGLKLVAMKLVHATEELAKAHYTEELAKRRGEHVRNYNINFMREGPIVAIVLEGLHAIETVRKMVGSTEPKAALPGTIRAEFAHMSYAYAAEKKTVVRNLIHASSDKADAVREIKVWFAPSEIFKYKTVHDVHLQ